MLCTTLLDVNVQGYRRPLSPTTQTILSGLWLAGAGYTFGIFCVINLGIWALAGFMGASATSLAMKNFRSLLYLDTPCSFLHGLCLDGFLAASVLLYHAFPIRLGAPYAQGPALCISMSCCKQSVSVICASYVFEVQMEAVGG